MRTLKSFLIVAVGCAALSAFVPACSSSDSGSGSTGATNTATTGNATTGMATYTKDLKDGACSMCHGPDTGGLLGPNISGAATVGLGGWTEEQFYQVVRNGKLPSGKTVCQYMIKYPSSELSDQDIADLFAYTQTQMATTAQAGSYVTLDATCGNK